MDCQFWIYGGRPIRGCRGQVAQESKASSNDERAAHFYVPYFVNSGDMTSFLTLNNNIVWFEMTPGSLIGRGNEHRFGHCKQLQLRWKLSLFA